MYWKAISKGQRVIKVLRAYSHLTAHRSGLNEISVEVCWEAVIWERPNRPNDLPLLDVTLSEYRFDMAPRRTESGGIDESIKRIHSAAIERFRYCVSLVGPLK